MRCACSPTRFISAQGGVENVVAKLVGTELNHRMAMTAMDMLGDYATLGRGEQRAFDRGIWSAQWFGSIARMFGGGTSQIQKNVIAERGLGMPKSRRLIRAYQSGALI